jgi:hypothetical protein
MLRIFSFAIIAAGLLVACIRVDVVPIRYIPTTNMGLPEKVEEPPKIEEEHV